MKPNSATETVIWLATVLCVAAAVIVLLFQDGAGKAIAPGCAALVFAIIGGSIRRKASSQGRR
ncbi:hypothetical protein [Microbispora sp. NPDC049125]|uniref:hypothetical protein n=1 Tax=Microbispora sp. NPDC049125 TaxID=3154929 RepID=UPI00346560EC